MSTLDLRTTQKLIIKADSGKNFDVLLSGFDALDTAYTLVLGATTYTVGSGITLDEVNKTITISFEGSDFPLSSYTGELNSDNKDADVFLRIEITLELS